MAVGGGPGLAIEYGAAPGGIGGPVGARGAPTAGLATPIGGAALAIGGAIGGAPCGPL